MKKNLGNIFHFCSFFLSFSASKYFLFPSLFILYNSKKIRHTNRVGIFPHYFGIINLSGTKGHGEWARYIYPEIKDMKTRAS